MKPLSNLPIENRSNEITEYFDQYFQFPVQLETSTIAAFNGFFENRKFDKTSAESISYVLLSQAKRDNVNPMVILDTLEGLSDIELSALVGEILNFNRFKTSSIGRFVEVVPPEWITRNIMA